MAAQHFSERELALLCLGFVIPSEVEESLDVAGKARLMKKLEMSRLRST